MSNKVFDESIFSDFRSSTKESLQDISIGQNEIDKIEISVSNSLNKADLRVDYSDFSNHVFFGSAYSAVNYSLSRIVNDYPFDGEYKDKAEWKKSNTGFENYFFENYPKYHGHMYFRSGSGFKQYVEFDDFDNKLNPGSSSICLEANVRHFHNINAGNTLRSIFSYSDTDDSNGVRCYLSGNGKRLIFWMASASVQSSVNISWHPYLSQSRTISCVYDQPTKQQIIYVDGIKIASASAAFGDTIDVSQKRGYIGAMSSSTWSGGNRVWSLYSGSIDEVRYFRGPTRTSEQIYKNWNRTIDADVSGGLQLYYKFNTSHSYDRRVIDFSGNEIHGYISGTFTASVNLVSGTILPGSFSDSGDPIFDLTNGQVVSYVEQWRSSGSSYDSNNSNFIYNIVPRFLVEEESQNEDFQKFLLLLARHYDRLKLYIQHIANIYNTRQSDSDNTPDDLISFVASHFGISIGPVFENASPLSLFFGEDVITTGSLASSVDSIRNQLRRNLLSNLIYFIKTKGTRESIESSLRSLGIDENIVSVNEYSGFTGSIQTSETFKTVESKVLKFGVSSSVLLTSSVYSDSEPRSYEFRVLFNTASSYLTSSIFTLHSGSLPFFYVDIERNSLTSSAAKVRLYASESASSPLTVSDVEIYDNNWINFLAYRHPTGGSFGLRINKLNYDEITISSSVSAADALPGPHVSIVTASLGTRSGSIHFFDGCMQEFRAWNTILSSSVFNSHTKDFSSLEVSSFLGDINSLVCHLKMNDFTGSAAGSGTLHDSATGLAGCTYHSFSVTASSNFPGKFINKLDPSYSYDVTVNGSKARIKNSSVFTDEDIVEDIPYVTVDISPAISLNKEIVRWFGGIDKFNDIIGNPWNKHRDEIPLLNRYRRVYFDSKINKKINFKSYYQLIKWFDSNFSFFLKQFIPLDVNSSISNFVIEPHIFEINRYEHQFANKKGLSPLVLEASSSASPSSTAALTAEDLPLADPGRWGSVVLATGSVDVAGTFLHPSTSNGINFYRPEVKKAISDFYMANSSSYSPDGYGNGWHCLTITGSDYLKNVLNVYSEFNISGVHYAGDSITSNYLSTSHGTASLSPYTSSFAGVQDLRWLWRGAQSGVPVTADILSYNYGLGYGGAIGQLPFVSKRHLNSALYPAGSSFHIGRKTYVNMSRFFQNPITTSEESDSHVSYRFWPSSDSFDSLLVGNMYSSPNTTGSIVSNNGQYMVIDSFGENLETRGYKYASVRIVGSKVFESTAINSHLKFFLKFQFFSEESPGNTGDTILSSSITSTFVETKQKEQVYIFSLTPEEASSFNIFFDREIPNCKYIRVFMRMEFPTGDTYPNIYRILPKITLSNIPSNVQNDAINIRRT